MPEHLLLVHTGGLHSLSQSALIHLAVVCRRKLPAVPEVTVACAESPETDLGPSLFQVLWNTELFLHSYTIISLFFLQFITWVSQAAPELRCHLWWYRANLDPMVQCLGLEMLGGTCVIPNGTLGPQGYSQQCLDDYEVPGIELGVHTYPPCAPGSLAIPLAPFFFPSFSYVLYKAEVLMTFTSLVL